MPTVSIGTTDKRINSTKQTFSSSYSADCKLKEPCSMHDPVFVVQGLSKSNFYNYASFEGRYYRVDNIVYLTNDIQEVHCSLDALATYKTAIKNTPAFVQFCSTVQNHWADDPRFNVEKEDTSYSSTKEIETLSIFDESGTVVLRYMDSGNGGGVKQVAMTMSAFGDLFDDLYNELGGHTFEEIVALLGGVGSWRDNIISCTWLPFDMDQYYGQWAAQIRLGCIICPVDTPFTVKFIDGLVPIRKRTVGVTINFDDVLDMPFLRNARWYGLQFVSPFGYCNVPIDTIIDNDTLYCTMVANLISGDISYRLTEDSKGNGQVLGSFSGNVAMDMMGFIGTGVGVHQQLNNGLLNGAKLALGSASLGLSMGQSFMSASNSSYAASAALPKDTARADFKNDVGTRAAVASGINGIGSVANFQRSSACATGSTGGGSASIFLTENPGACFLVKKVFVPNISSTDTYDEYCQEYGYPCNDYFPNGLPDGYVQCAGASCVGATGATLSDLNTINSYLNSGIFIE